MSLANFKRRRLLDKQEARRAEKDTPVRRAAKAVEALKEAVKSVKK